MTEIDTLQKGLTERLGTEVITLAHGSGGKAMQKLIDQVILAFFGQPNAGPLEDQAILDLSAYPNHSVALTTDSYVVTPLHFPGSSIGHLAVNGTVNDLSVSGAIPLYLTCGLIIEEGLLFKELIDVLADMAKAAQQAKVKIVTGDTKVVDRGSCDKLFINTAGVGVVSKDVDIRIPNIQVGDKILLNGDIGDHGVAILAARGELDLQTTIQSDCQPLNDLIQTLLSAGLPIKAMRDVTRGGVATVLNEFAQGSQLGILIQEGQLPMKSEVRGVCEVLGLDPLYLANEGKVAVVLPADYADLALEQMRRHPAGQNSHIVAEVVDDHAGRVVMQSDFGGKRVVDMLVGEQLPRIC
jgi:hydrogenase expression/formation protein HypE